MLIDCSRFILMFIDFLRFSSVLLNFHVRSLISDSFRRCQCIVIVFLILLQVYLDLLRCPLMFSDVIGSSSISIEFSRFSYTFINSRRSSSMFIDIIGSRRIS